MTDDSRLTPPGDEGPDKDRLIRQLLEALESRDRLLARLDSAARERMRALQPVPESERDELARARAELAQRDELVAGLTRRVETLEDELLSQADEHERQFQEQAEALAQALDAALQRQAELERELRKLGTRN